MNLVRQPRPAVLFLLALSCLAHGVNAIQSPTTIEEGRQYAASADDNASTLEGRKEALGKLQEAARLFLSADETVEAARVLNRIGRLQLVLNDPKEALASHNQALNILKEKPNTEVEVDNLNGLAAAYMRLRQAEKAEPLLRQALSQSEQSDYKAGQAQALLTLSDLQNYQNHAVALQTAQKALAVWQLVNDKIGLAGTYSQMGQCYLAQNQLPEATQNYQTALQLWQDLNSKSGQARALVSLGFIEFRKGSWQEAITYYTQAQELIDDQAEPRRMGQIAVGLAEAFNESGLPEIGLGHFQRALEYYRQTQDPAFIAYGMWGLGCTYYLLGDYDQAIAQFNQALAEVPADSIQAAQCHEYLGRVYIARREYAVAQQHLITALVTYNRTLNPKEAAQAQGLIGEIYQQQGQAAEARKYYQQALTGFNNLSDRLNEAAILCALGRLELRAEDYDVAEGYLRQSIDVTENMRRVPTSSDLTVAFSATVHERYQSYIECLMRKHQAQPGQGFAVRAFEISELARGRSLVDLLRATQTTLLPGLDPQLAERERSLRQSLRVKEDSKVHLLGRKYNKEELDAVEAELARLEAEYKQVTETIRTRYPAYQQITRSRALSLRQIQEQVIADDQTLLLEYSLGEDKSYVWAVSRAEVSSYELPGRAEIENAARRLYGSLTANQPVVGETFEQHQARVQQAEAQLPSETATLSNLVLAPVVAKLGAKRLLIVADGALQYIPFQVLTVGANASGASARADEQRPLMLEHEIINEPSASTLALVLSESANRTSVPKNVAILADPVFEADDPRLISQSSGSLQASLTNANPDAVTRAFRDVGVDRKQVPRLLASRAEAEAIMAVLPWRTGFMAIDFDANRTRVTTSDLGQYRIVHFATHAVLDDKHPESSGIVLSRVDQKGQPQNGFLSLHDIYNLKLPVDLVVLSACQTGLGKDVRGEGLIGLTRGFMFAGASGVVASLWKVDDDATAELMKHFYAGMFEKGLSPATALREAQLALWNQKQWHEPYFWAGFIIQGQYSGRESMNRTPARIFEWVAAFGTLGAALSLTIIFLLRRRRKRNL